MTTVSDSNTDNHDTNTALNTQLNDEAGEKIGQRVVGYFSWLLLMFAIMVLIFGCYVAYNAIISRPTANVMITNTDLTQAHKFDIQKRLDNVVQGNFFTADLYHIKDNLVDMDWVDAVKVSRQWPNGINVTVVPRHAIARFGSERFISHDGYVFSMPDTQNISLERLPILYGPQHKTADIMRQYHQVNTWFKASNIHLTELSLTERMTWFLKFDTGLRVIVDREDTQAKLYRLSQSLEANLKPVKTRIESIDLRYRNGMSILWKNQRKPQHLKWLLAKKTQ